MRRLGADPSAETTARPRPVAHDGAAGESIQELRASGFERPRTLECNDSNGLPFMTNGSDCARWVGKSISVRSDRSSKRAARRVPTTETNRRRSARSPVSRSRSVRWRKTVLQPALAPVGGGGDGCSVVRLQQMTDETHAGGASDHHGRRFFGDARNSVCVYERRPLARSPARMRTRAPPLRGGTEVRARPSTCATSPARWQSMPHPSRTAPSASPRRRGGRRQRREALGMSVGGVAMTTASTSLP
jgi:hypothetical protein